MDKYLITGSSGFVAQHFLDFLEDNQIQCEVLGVDLKAVTPTRQFKYVKIQNKDVDLLNYEQLEETILSFKPDFILHLASFSSVAFSWKHPKESFRNNVNIFLNLLEAVRNNSLNPRILSIGSSEEYGKVTPQEIPIKETNELRPLSPYAVARVSQEMMSKLYVDSYGMDVIITRSFNHIGPGQKDIFVIPSFVKQFVNAKKEGKKVVEMSTGDLSIIRDFTDVRDVVKAYYLLLHKGKAGEIYNICSGKPVKLSDILNITGELIGITPKTNINSDLIRPNDNPLIIGDNTKIKEHTGWKLNYNLEKSLEDIIKFWESEIIKGDEK